MTKLNKEEYVITEMSKLSSEELINQIKNISYSAWNRHLEIITLRSWLNNFTGECLGSKKAEQNLALWIALHFVLYTDQDIRSLSSNLWWRFIHEKMEEFETVGFMINNTLKEKYNYIVENTVIQPLGNCGGSGTNVCYFFRQSNGLKKEMFDMKEESEYKYLVLVDDATVSGHQAMEFLDRYSHVADDKKHLLTYISTKKARTYIGDSVQLISSIELDDKSKCFDENSYVFFRHKSWINVAKKMCKYYGLKIDPHNPIGYRKGQYTFGFYYNIPNNTLPIFWGNMGGWVPLFDRYFSDYNKQEELNNEKFY